MESNVIGLDLSSQKDRTSNANLCMINGTSYELILSTSKQCPKLNDTDGYCDTDSKQIIVRQPTDLNVTECYKWWLSARLNPIARREYIKAFNYEVEHGTKKVLQ